MSTCFDRWEKDPFFPVAEEVQESADRMESVYRRWIHERRDASNPGSDAKTLTSDLRRDLHTALGTAKWQLDELDRAVRSNDEVSSAGEDTRTRHSQFVEAIGNQILTVENSLKESNVEAGEAAMSWVQLNEGDRNELALFLSGTLPPLPPREKKSVIRSIGDPIVRKNMQETDGEGEKNSCSSNGFAQLEAKKERVHGHRRSASASADIGAWKISVSKEIELPNLPLPKTPSFSCLTKVLEATPKVKWSKNGFRKWKGGDQHQEDETIPLHNQQTIHGLNACYERSKSYLSSCGDGSYDKKLYGWIGALHRQLQRSQYQFQYGRPIQMILLAIAIVLLFGYCVSVIFRNS